MFKRKKDGGFTLIELMIVIAVIGILAVVLVPKVGGIKTSAKTAGLDVNVRTVQAYAESRITKWSKDGSAQDVVDSEINTAMTSGNNVLENPIDGKKTTAYVQSGATNAVAGSVYVIVNPSTAGSTYKVTIYALESNNNVFKTVEVTP